MSAQSDDTDPVIFRPFLAHGARGRMTANLVLVASIALASVTSKNRATPQLLQADLGASGAAGPQAVINTQGGKASLAWVWKLVSGTTFALSQPSTRTVVPIASHVTEVNSWANTDSAELRAPVNVNLVEVRPRMLDPDALFDNAFYLDGINAWDPVGLASSPCYLGACVIPQECSFQRNVFYDTWPLDGISTPQPQNCAFLAGITTDRGGEFGGGETTVASLLLFGGILQWNAFTVQGLSAVDLDGDIIVGNPQGSNLVLIDAVLGTVYFDTGTVSLQGSCGTENGASGIIWGPGGFDIFGQSRLVINQSTATAALLLKGSVTINGNATASAYNEAVDPATWHAARALNTPSIGAQLDAAIAAGGFGNRALRPEGGAILVINAS